MCPTMIIIDIATVTWPIYPVFYNNTDDLNQAAATEKWVGGLRDDFLTKFENLLTTNKGGDGFFVGSGVCVLFIQLNY